MTNVHLRISCLMCWCLFWFVICDLMRTFFVWSDVSVGLPLRPVVCSSWGSLTLLRNWLLLLSLFCPCYQQHHHCCCCCWLCHRCSPRTSTTALCRTFNPKVMSTTSILRPVWASTIKRMHCPCRWWSPEQMATTIGIRSSKTDYRLCFYFYFLNNSFIFVTADCVVLQPELWFDSHVYVWLPKMVVVVW